MSRRLLALNVLLALVGSALAIGLARELLAPRPLPLPPAPRVVSTAKNAPPTLPAPAPAAYGVIAAKNLFSPSRSEGSPAGPVAATSGPRPVLHGVVMDGAKSRAYLEDPLLKRTFGYAVGDTIAGGRLESIGPDRVVIARAEGPIEVLLKDPSKPKPAEPVAPVAVGAVSSPALAGGGVAQPPPAIAPPAATVAPAALPLPSQVPPALAPVPGGRDR
ncbi:MAG TPA: hypothetical protein VL086_08075 [Candidatus Nitrosotalea sp.]|nr:hypothetical protein [Candidatus Nitrosotalea sp.]